MATEPAVPPRMAEASARFHQGDDDDDNEVFRISTILVRRLPVPIIVLYFVFISSYFVDGYLFSLGIVFWFGCFLSLHHEMYT